ncbi:class I SAM-dependent DNA methyltransferase [Polaromonas sp.]|uniref:class I SAM-dependent DNA methyltransferase n=1 Tax=Polaromonas sp. TaxID=1869339 RepID=UPI00356A7C9C
MTPQTFIQKWGPGGPAFHLNEEQGAQSHFIDLCDLLGVPKPGSEAGYLFEEKNAMVGGRTGYADVFKRGAFAWENKAPGKNLDAALRQLQSYSLALSNPPILVVCDRLSMRIYTQFSGHPTETHLVLLAELDQPDKQALLRRIWLEPESFRPKKTSRDITEAAAKSFATLADSLRKRGPAKEADAAGFQTHADEVAHFLTQCLFCFFAEDVGLLPGRMFEGLVNNRKLTSDKLTTGLHNLFTVMQGGGLYGNDDIPWFNGGLFKKINVPALTVLEMTELRNAAALNWSAIDVSIFGTLFERGLDPSKRSQLGAHYTDPATIMRIVEPVLQRPLLQIWEQTAQEIRGLMAKNKKKNDASYKAARTRFIQWLDRLKDYRVLDPACGSGNFLFLGLKTLKDIEHQSHIDAALMGLDREADLVTGPHNMLGIELNEYAAELARVTVWIGELQWRLLHGYEFKTNPVLEPLDNIECRDALLTFIPGFSAKLPLPPGEGRGEGSPTAIEAAWPKASVVIGNPPFLGGSKKRRELGDAYFEALASVFKGRVPGGADLVCYWFDKARIAIQTQGLGAAGLVATQSIRAGSNRAVLSAICEATKIYAAWSDESWVNEGAAVRVSLICFGHADQESMLDGRVVSRIGADLSDVAGADITQAGSLVENKNVSFEGAQKNGPFDIEGQIARSWLRLPNPHSRSNTLVLKPYLNAAEVTGRRADSWMIDFHGYSEGEAELFDAPFTYVRRVVKPVRETKREEYLLKRYWLLKRPAIDLRAAVNGLDRYIVTPRVAKHRFFVWMSKVVLPDSRLNSIVRADDTTFGILSSRIHEVWALAQASIHGDGSDGGRPTYNAKSCFETFPFPEGLTPADTAHQKTEAIAAGSPHPRPLPEGEGVEAEGEGVNAGEAGVDAALVPAGLAGAVRTNAVRIAIAAKRLNDLREAWLNPPEWTQRVPEVVPLGMTSSPYPDRILPRDGFEKELADRTLTKLYNQRPAWLDAAHKALDSAVAAAYGWADYTPDMPDEEILKRLLALNLQRAA